MSRVTTCQYPLWGSKPVKRSELSNNFCGEPVKPHEPGKKPSSYCEKHHKICWVKHDPDAPKTTWNHWGAPNVKK